MRLLLVNRFFADARTPTGRMLEDVAKALVAAGHQVTVLCSGAGYVTGAKGEGKVSTREYRVHRVATPFRSRVLSWAWFLLNCMVVAGRLSWDRCLVLTDPPFLAAAVLLSDLRLGRPCYWWTMDLYPEALVAARRLEASSFACRLLAWVNEVCFGRVAGVVSLGTTQLGLCSRYRRWRTEPSYSLVVPPWDDRPIQPSMPAERFAADMGWQGKKVALYAGNLGEGHLYEEILAAARVLDSVNRTDWLFVFAIRGAGRGAVDVEAARLRNLVVMDYLPEALTGDLLWSASVHLITMKPGWEGVIVPSKLYGVARTPGPVLFIGPKDSDTASEIHRLGLGLTLPPGSAGEAVVAMLDDLSHSASSHSPFSSGDSARAVAAFVCRQ